MAILSSQNVASIFSTFQISHFSVFLIFTWLHFVFRNRSPSFVCDWFPSKMQCGLRRETPCQKREEESAAFINKEWLLISQQVGSSSTVEDIPSGYQADDWWVNFTPTDTLLYTLPPLPHPFVKPSSSDHSSHPSYPLKLQIFTFLFTS